VKQKGGKPTCSSLSLIPKQGLPVLPEGQGWERSTPHEHLYKSGDGIKWKMLVWASFLGTVGLPHTAKREASRKAVLTHQPT
jgi:hypothetical protein